MAIPRPAFYTGTRHRRVPSLQGRKRRRGGRSTEPIAAAWLGSHSQRVTSKKVTFWVVPHAQSYLKASSIGCSQLACFNSLEKAQRPTLY